MKSLIPVGAAAAAAAVLALVPAGSATTADAARLAPTLSIAAGAVDEPVRVPLANEDPAVVPIAYVVTVSGGPATNVTVTASGEGLVLPPPQQHGSVADKVNGSASVGATTGGFHALTLTVTADGAAPASTTLKYVWAPTGRLTLDGNQHLSYYAYATSGTYSSGGSTREDSAMLLFYPGGKAFYGVPTFGDVSCRKASTTATSGCLKYTVGTKDHIIQIGGAIGYVRGSQVKRTIHTIGLGRPDEGRGEVYAHRTWRTEVAFPNKMTFSGTWRFRSDDPEPSGMTQARITMREDGTFTLTDDFGERRTIQGRYRTRAFGGLELTGRFGTELHTFAPVLKKNRILARNGVWMSFGTNRRNAELVFLEHVR